jgi:hypothetical protein
MFYQHMNENLMSMDLMSMDLMSMDLMSMDLMSMGHLLYVVSFLEQAMDGAFNNNHSKEPPQVRDAWVMD